MEKNHHRRKIRYADTDIMRILASFGVVLLHAATYTSGIGLFDKDTAQIINIFCRFSVPVFVMISGQYMLSEKRSVASVWGKALSMFLILIAVSAAYTAYEYITGGYLMGFSDTITRILTEPVHLWYLYMVICLYIFTPVMYVFASNADKGILVYCIFLCFLFGSIIYIPVHSTGFELLKTIIGKCKIDVSLGFVGCYLFGSYVERFGLSSITRKIIYLTGAAGIIITICADRFLPLADEENRELIISFFAPNVLVVSTAVYIGIKSLVLKNGIPKKLSAAISDVAQCTFGIYLWHVMALHFIIRGIKEPIGAAAIFFITVSVYIICYIVTRIFKALFGRKL